MIKNIFIITFCSLSFLFAQKFDVQRIEPPNWWFGMKTDTVQILLYGKNVGSADIYPSHRGATVIDYHKAESPDYLFIDLLIDNSITDNLNFEIGLATNEYDTVITFPILQREKREKAFQGFNQSDVVYLIMADRFCDGNPDNNNIGDSLDEFTEKDLDGRKGGDIEGIISKLDYLTELGVSAIWITPMLENNMWMSYHGYAATDLFKVDPRFGSNELYKKLVDEAHKKDLKIIMDHVSNHIGINHWWIKDLPFKNWINGEPGNHLPANHNKMTFPDPYSPGESVVLTWNGWFTDYMPDLNQSNPFLKKYLIQNTIWWIEYLGIDGIREDTYPYVNQYYLSDWAKIILNEYPNFNIVGEIWTGEATFLAAYQRNNKFGLKLNSNLPSVTDFALADAFRDFLSGKKGLDGIFNILAMDYIYSEPENLLTFIDNHDIARGLYLANGNINKFKVALTILLTTRGIPKILYGTEIGIVGDDRHGTIRTPFPGGFKFSDHNAFSKCGRTDIENDIFNYTQKLISLRKNFKSLSEGNLIHYYPFNNLYVYFRNLNEETTMIVVNGSDKKQTIDFTSYSEMLSTKSKLIDLMNDYEIIFSNNSKMEIEPLSSKIFLIEK
ncbi:Alpha-amylase [Ignavibacterium album JCM 16511]|uniref:Alpha-amylase n=1 Tax=Ignavibacterium album (strain DSM 19864 / JCM 16511 / NBRC 101810 / Mat9-16) TaxID=945713 RepID=I0AKE0_IGNAJ|nr:alpha-amylase family glycosyl hydrolase [Ignavibacterium album]AFH49447.1 Alpha-amylase [Ignavibacterium album JCM 16511]